MKPSWVLILLAMILFGCSSGQVSTRLAEIDSLVVREQYDSACVMLKDVAETSMTAEEQAHYYLLATQLGYLTNQPLPSDSLLDLAILYYNKVGNNQKLANAYYYKSIGPEKNTNYSQAILYGKKAETLAIHTTDERLKYKIAENLSYLNGLCENSQLQLQYAHKALAIAQRTQNKNWLVYSFNNISFAFYGLGQYDSALVYVEKTIPYFEDVYDYDKAEFLTNVGQLYKERDKDKAKEYFKKALTYGELPDTYEHLADVYYAEGNKEEAYRLWKKALTVDSRYNKDNLIYSILSYDLEHGNLEEASKNLDEVIAIKDSMLYLLRNDTIKDLQLRFDQQVAMHEQEQITNKWQKVVLVVLLFVVILLASIVIKRYQEKNRMQEIQLQLNDLMSQKRQLEASGEQKSETIESLNKEIEELLARESLNEGRMLYEQIMRGEAIVNWTGREESLFCQYYATVRYQEYHRLSKVKRASKMSDRKMFYLILKQMGKTDEEVKRIMALSPEGLRTLRSRTKPIEDDM